MGSARRLLVIEDDPEQRETLRDRLSARGLEVAAASGGEDGLTAASKGLFDAILCDMTVPDCSRKDLLGRLRTAGVGTPMILMSGSAAAEEVIDGLRDGAVSFISKPFELDDVCWLIERACAPAAPAGEKGPA